MLNTIILSILIYTAIITTISLSNKQDIVAIHSKITPECYKRTIPESNIWHRIKCPTEKRELKMSGHTDHSDLLYNKK